MLKFVNPKMNISLTVNQYKDTIIYSTLLDSSDKKLLQMFLKAPQNSICKECIQKVFGDKDINYAYVRIHRLAKKIESYHKLGIESVIKSKRARWHELFSELVSKEEKVYHYYQAKPNLIKALEECSHFITVDELNVARA